MTEIVAIVVGAALVNNFVLVRFLGLCPLLGTGSRLDDAAGMSAATTIVLTATAIITWLLDSFLLIPFDLGFLRIIVFIMVVAAVVQLTELAIRRTSPILHRRLGIYLPLITTNCAILGVALLNAGTARNLGQAIALGLGAGLGFGLVMVCFAALRERLDAAPVPAPFRGAGIALVTAGMMSLAFIGFAGLDRG